jgi:hypothetical protein
MQIRPKNPLPFQRGFCARAAPAQINAENINERNDSMVGASSDGYAMVVLNGKAGYVDHKDR